MTEPRIRTKHPGIYTRNERFVVWYNCSGCKPDGSCPGHTESLPAGSLLRDAVARRAELVSKKATGRVIKSTVRLASYAPLWLDGQKGNLRPKTVETYSWGIRVWIVPNLGQVCVAELSIDDVARLVSTMKARGLKAWTIRAALTPLSRMMNHAVRGGLASANPVRGLDKSERPKGDQRQMRILSSDEIERLLSPVPLLEGYVGAPVSTALLMSAETPSKEKRPPLSDDWRPLITFLLFTGLRISEALNTRWEDIDLENGTVTVKVSKTQAGTGRSVILIPALVSVLRRHRLRSAYSAPHDYVFANNKGRKADKANILTRVLKPALATAGIQHTTLHELRHTFASILISEGMDITFVANQLGHSDPSITLRVYAHLYEPEARKTEAREKLQTAFGGLL